MDTEVEEISEQEIRELGTAIWNIQHSRFLSEVACEVAEAESRYPPMNSAHEAYAVLLEEVDELWEEVKRSPSRRDPAAMWQELVQVAAMAVRFALDVMPDGPPTTNGAAP